MSMTDVLSMASVESRREFSPTNRLPWLSLYVADGRIRQFRTEDADLEIFEP